MSTHGGLFIFIIHTITLGNFSPSAPVLDFHKIPSNGAFGVAVKFIPMVAALKYPNQ
jgi:hypothetical protein